MQPFEVRYLDVQWRDPDTVIKLEASREPLELERLGSGWAVQTLTFPSLGHYIGIRVTSKKLKHTPYFLLADGRREMMLPLNVPGTEDIWWIQKGEWHQNTKRYLSELYRTAGRVELIIQEQSLTIENNTSNFSVSELEYYLNDFKNSLWMLILDNESAAHAQIEKEAPGVFDHDVLKLFSSFVDSVESLIKKPNMVLNEVQSRRPARSVRPVMKTFREIVTHPNAKLLTSRDYSESYDTAENRYIHHAVNRFIYVMKSLLRVLSAQDVLLDQRLAQEKKWLDTYANQAKKRIDPSVFDNEIQAIKRNIEDLQKQLSDILYNTTFQYDPRPECLKKYDDSYVVEVGECYGKRRGQYFVKKLNGEDFRKKYETYLVLVFPENLDVSDVEYILKKYPIKISGILSKHKNFNSKNVEYFEICFSEVKSIEVLPPKELIRLEKRKDELELTDWVEPLTLQELQERDIEANVVRRKLRKYATLKNDIFYFSKSISSLLNRIKPIQDFFIANKIKTQHSCPNSMTFVQDPAYASAKSHFRKISSINGIDESIIASLVLIDSIGLVNISNLYEKWCLIKIINILVNVYGFETSNDWQRTLIDSVLKSRTDIEIQMKSEIRQQRIILTYEKTLSSGKRPDFVLDLFSKKYINDKNKWFFNGEVKFRLVLDAKFRGDVSEDVINRLVDQLYFDAESVNGGKDYSEGGTNQVFIIHPSRSVIDSRTSPLEWGNSCDYGQANSVRHCYGSIFLSPTLSESDTTDNLQRLFGMFLQKHSHILMESGGKRLFWHNMCCVGCGNSDHKSLAVTLSPTKSGSDRWIIECKRCGVRTIKTICVSCHNEIFKNGPKWTYHRTRAEQTSNVVCPECETFL
ncbi:nuclease domain-containing protein [Microbulbifer thermotolerans]|uniref:Nuclease domain-containing protein n=1 Tax=Microbulbifer thermotolerans TaxID=252514 RepID=A0AB35HVF9_MICTH|nr:nuclease domain-containing protein [Microbulbifer thermotolerans]MCX2781096.1 nuclease domain-containing protein [Microbulbifer thermotolerans]MCX2801105.1 nuclease domain-containing protein [Microbulbifer thermotolerans]MCX2804474.1 nuclease domain-containing protein [Microbulbifer thermotolerans]MCX2831254.1 nuclease domain-containing protein [Microbulbifer thermotolerans]